MLVIKWLGIAKLLSQLDFCIEGPSSCYFRRKKIAIYSIDPWSLSFEQTMLPLLPFASLCCTSNCNHLFWGRESDVAIRLSFPHSTISPQFGQRDKRTPSNCLQ